MKTPQINLLVLLGVLSIVIILAIQGWWLSKSWDINEREFDERVRTALYNVALDLEVFSNSTLPSENLISRLQSNYYVVNINGQIDHRNLEFFLNKRLEEVSLTEDYEYGIFDCHDKQMVMGKHVTFDRNKQVRELKEPLPTADGITYYFGIRFPERTNTLLGNMQLTILLSTLLMLIAFFVGYAMVIIIQQKQLSELQRDFINNMTHEFKTPIATINVSADVLKQFKPQTKADYERFGRYASIIKAQAERLNGQVERVLQLAKLEHDSLNLEFATFDLNEWIMNILPSLELKAEENKGIICLDLSPEPIHITADKDHFTNIVHNLVDNAVKYSRTPAKVTIGTSKDLQFVHFSVADKGIGIKPEHQKKIFSKFYRAPTGNVHNVKGFGLGLYYVKYIIEQHRWSFNIDSKPGAGTKIALNIPVQQH